MIVYCQTRSNIEILVIVQLLFVRSSVIWHIEYFFQVVGVTLNVINFSCILQYVSFAGKTTLHPSALLLHQIHTVYLQEEAVLMGAGLFSLQTKLTDEAA